MSEQPPIEPPDDEETTPVEEPAHELGTTPPPPTGGDKIEPIDLNTEMQRSYIDYAMAVIVSRALPDVRDGLKPVHRRVLYAMYDGGYRPDRGYNKCSRVVGDVMGQYHPHGDSAIYDALVRCAAVVAAVSLGRRQGNFAARATMGGGAAIHRSGCQCHNSASPSLSSFPPPIPTLRRLRLRPPSFNPPSTRIISISPKPPAPLLIAIRTTAYRSSTPMPTPSTPQAHPQTPRAYQLSTIRPPPGAVKTRQNLTGDDIREA